MASWLAEFVMDDDTPRHSAAWKIWRDNTHDTVSALFALENEPEQTSRDIYKGIQGLIESTCYGIMTILKCFRSILRLSWGKGGKPLPDDVVLDILRRLPAKDILNCRMVCRRWMSLTSTPYFCDLHLTGSPPMILLHHYLPEGDLRLYSIDLTPEEPCIKRLDTKKLQLDRDDPPFFGGTCDGMVLLWSRGESISSLSLFICNPLSGRKIMEVAPKGFFFCGFWFHPTKQEYFFLTASICDDHIFLYRIFNLQGKSTVVGWYGTYPMSDVPININGSIYNLLQYPVPPHGCIMIFDIYSEKFEFGPHPHNGHCNHGQNLLSNHKADMCLLEVEGSLGFAHVCSSPNNLHLWILADSATWRWIPRYKLNLNNNLSWDPSVGAVFALSGIQKGEILIHYDHRRLFAVNLETRRVRKIDISISHPTVDRFLSATSYASSIIGLNRLASYM